MMYPHAEEALKNGIEYAYGSGVHGDVAEFGCFQGRTAAVLAARMKWCDGHHGRNDQLHGISERKLRIFDSFKGLPAVTHPADTQSPHILAEIWKEGEIGNTTVQLVFDKVREHLPAERIIIEPGFFIETLDKIPPTTKFAFVHIDCDYYESTIQVLCHLFREHMVSDGCAIYFDDWYCNRGSWKYGEQKAWSNLWELVKNLKLPYSYTDWGPYGIVGRRFIIHAD